MHSGLTRLQPDGSSENNLSGFLARDDGSHPVTQNSQVGGGKAAAGLGQEEAARRARMTGPWSRGGGSGRWSPAWACAGRPASPPRLPRSPAHTVTSVHPPGRPHCHVRPPAWPPTLSRPSTRLAAHSQRPSTGLAGERSGAQSPHTAGPPHSPWHGPPHPGLRAQPPTRQNLS